MQIEPNECITVFRNPVTEEPILEEVVCCTDEACVELAKNNLVAELGEIEVQTTKSYYQGDEPIYCFFCHTCIGANDNLTDNENE